MMSTKHILKISHSYSIYVAKNRAIPSVTDGLKHGQRMALWLLRNKSGKIKTMALTGSLLAEKIYVHGDASANNTISMLAGPFKNNVPLITGHGFFGSRVAPTDFGAPRYTDVSRSNAAQALLYSDLDLIPVTENYDGSAMEPVHFLPLLPMVLLNGVAGVAVGWSTEILPRSLEGLVQATIDALKGKQPNPKHLLPVYNRYDVQVEETEPNKYTIHGKVTINDSSSLTITNLPPGISLDAIKKRLFVLEEEGKISTFDDHSSDEIKIVVSFPRGSIKDWTEKKALDELKLRERITERIVVLDWNANGIKTYPDASSLIKDFVKWRLDWYEKRYQKYHDDSVYDLQYWKLLRAMFTAGFTKKLGTFVDRLAVETDVRAIAAKAKIVVDDSHIDRAVSLPTYRWTKSFEAEVANKIAEIEQKIKDYNAILADPDKRKEIYYSELDDLKKIKF